MNESEFKQLRELSWRRPLSPAEESQLQSYLAARPEEQQAWETEVALNQFLTDLPNVPLASNFTARVLSALDHDPAPARERGWLSRWRVALFPRLAWAGGLLSLAMLTTVGYRHHARNELARGVDLIVEAMPSEPAILQDFDAIQRWAQGPMVDQDLWVALNQPTP